MIHLSASVVRLRSCGAVGWIFHGQVSKDRSTGRRALAPFDLGFGDGDDDPGRPYEARLELAQERKGVGESQDRERENTEGRRESCLRPKDAPWGSMKTRRKGSPEQSPTRRDHFSRRIREKVRGENGARPRRGHEKGSGGKTRTETPSRRNPR